MNIPSRLTQTVFEFFRFENKNKSPGIKSGEHSGGCNNSNVSFIIFAIETAQVGRRIVLNENNYFFDKFKRFFLVFSTDWCDNDAQYFPLIVRRSSE